MKKLSIGIIPYKVENNEVYFLLGHPGGNYNDYWALLKGCMEKGEDRLETAIREFREESGIDIYELDPNARLEYLGVVNQSRIKDVGAYSWNCTGIDIDLSKCHSNLADGCTWNEIDNYKWMTYEDVIAKTHKSHKIFYDRIRLGLSNIYYI